MCDTLYQYNPESYKFIARVLFANGYFDVAITFCKKSASEISNRPLLGTAPRPLDELKRLNFQ